ncbi:hypothetical protein BV898_02370 [Hypsibius exemplaris]|uniref:Polycomb protein VEFS-Box domain-containing protein n=1 Tax=Hypsibius exemplaris TaxID=2072580 RepID=A0A1W0X7X5_HYPEX|nr:hypothetical protein BV898_02370 [Hypsibius exemplaris]
MPAILEAALLGLTPSSTSNGTIAPKAVGPGRPKTSTPKKTASAVANGTTNTSSSSGKTSATTSTKKKIPPPGVYLTSGQASRALAQMTDEEEDDESSRSSSTSSDASFHIPKRLIDPEGKAVERRSSPRKLVKLAGPVVAPSTTFPPPSIAKPEVAVESKKKVPVAKPVVEPSPPTPVPKEVRPLIKGVKKPATKTPAVVRSKPPGPPKSREEKTTVSSITTNGHGGRNDVGEAGKTNGAAASTTLTPKSAASPSTTAKTPIAPPPTSASSNGVASTNGSTSHLNNGDLHSEASHNARALQRRCLRSSTPRTTTSDTESVTKTAVAAKPTLPNGVQSQNGGGKHPPPMLTVEKRGTPVRTIPAASVSAIDNGRSPSPPIPRKTTRRKTDTAVIVIAGPATPLKKQENGHSVGGTTGKSFELPLEMRDTQPEPERTSRKRTPAFVAPPPPPPLPSVSSECSGVAPANRHDSLHRSRDSSTSQFGGDSSTSNSIVRSSSKFDAIWASKAPRSVALFSVSPEPSPDHNGNNINNNTSSPGVMRVRKHRQPRERFSPDTYLKVRRSKSVRSPPTSPRTVKKSKLPAGGSGSSSTGGRGTSEGDTVNGSGARSALMLSLDEMFPLPPIPPKMKRVKLENQNLSKEELHKLEDERFKAMQIAKFRKIQAQRRRRSLAAAKAAQGSAEGGEFITEPVGVGFKKKKKKIVDPSKETVVKKKKHNGHGPHREGTNDDLVGKIAEAAHIDTSIHDHKAIVAESVTSVFSPEPSLAESSNAPRKYKKKHISLPTSTNQKPNLTGFFHNQHPLLPANSKRTMTEDTTLTDLTTAIPTTLSEKSLLTILTSGSLVTTQSNVVYARWKYISEAKLLVRKCLTYNLTARRFAPPHSFKLRTEQTKKRNLDCVIQQLWQRRNEPAGSKMSKGSYLYPVDLEITSFSLLKPAADSPTGSKSSVPKETGKDADVQLAVMKKNPKETLVKDLLPPVLANASRLRGVTCAAGKSVSFPQRSKVRLEHWNMADFLVVNVESPPINTRNMGKVVAFNIGDIKDGLALEVAGHFSFRVAVRKGVPLGPSKVDYKFVIIFSNGQHYQVREMIALKHHLKGHSCVLCAMRCDSLVNLLRHLDGLHPSVGHEYDDETKRLYIWFAPEHDFVRAPVPGVVDHWGLLKYGFRDDGTALMYPGITVRCHADGRPVFQWVSPRYLTNQPADTLPMFDAHHVLKVYGLPVNPVRHYLHTNPVQTVRPNYDHLRDYDSDEETSWQDQYEHEKIHDFVDCNPQEKQFMCLWNAFTRRSSPIFSVRMREVLCRFVVQHAVEIELADAYPALCAQLSMFRRDGIITQAESLEVVKRYRSQINCQSQSMVAGPGRKDSLTGNGTGEAETNGF